MLLHPELEKAINRYVDSPDEYALYLAELAVVMAELKISGLENCLEMITIDYNNTDFLHFMSNPAIWMVDWLLDGTTEWEQEFYQAAIRFENEIVVIEEYQNVLEEYRE